MKKVPWAILAMATVILTPVTIVWGWWAFGGTWLAFGFANALLLGALNWEPLTGALVVATGPLGLADTFYRR